MARIRTIGQAAKEIKAKDPESSISQWWLRQLVISGKLKHHKAGNRYLLDLDQLEEFLRNPAPVDDNKPEYGKLRRVNV